MRIGRAVATGWPLLVPLLFAVTLLFVAAPARVNASSMSPTLASGDHVLVDELSYRFTTPHRGDVVTLHRPGGAQLLVKRVAAVGGDTVGIEDGVLIVNGRTVRERYVDYPHMDSVYFGPVTVPPGDVFVLGDNRPDSVDSRDFGSVPNRVVTGRVLLRLWPLHAG
jgi:signal peptidase I